MMSRALQNHLPSAWFQILVSRLNDDKLCTHLDGEILSTKKYVTAEYAKGKRNKS